MQSQSSVWKRREEQVRCYADFGYCSRPDLTQLDVRKLAIAAARFLRDREIDWAADAQLVGSGFEEFEQAFRGCGAGSVRASLSRCACCATGNRAFSLLVKTACLSVLAQRDTGSNRLSGGRRTSSASASGWRRSCRRLSLMPGREAMLACGRHSSMASGSTACGPRSERSPTLLAAAHRILAS